MGCFQALPEISRGRQIGLNAGPAALGHAQSLETDYDVQWTNPLGRGHYGKVYRGWHKRTRRAVAIKVLERSKSRRERLRREVEILRKIGRHPHVVELLDVYETPVSVVLVLELMAGELFERVVSAGPYQEHEAAAITRKLAELLRHLHSMGIVHRDLKPENLLMVSKDPGSEIKLADFGLAHIHPVAQDNMNTVCGTWAYSAPEVKLMRKPYSHMVDCWSLGIIIYILLSGFHPFDPLGDATEEQLQENIRRGKYDFTDPVFDKVSSSAKALIQGLLQLDPRKRLDTPAVLQHSWLQKHSRLWNAQAAGGGLPAPSPRGLGGGGATGGSTRDLVALDVGGGKPGAERAPLSAVFPNASGARPQSARGSAAGAAGGAAFGGAGMTSSALAAYANRLRHRSASIEQQTARASESPMTGEDAVTSPQLPPPVPATLLAKSPSLLQLAGADAMRSPLPTQAGPPTPVAPLAGSSLPSPRAALAGDPDPAALTSREDASGLGPHTGTARSSFDRSPHPDSAAVAAYRGDITAASIPHGGRVFTFGDQQQQLQQQQQLVHQYHARSASESSHASAAFVGIDARNAGDSTQRSDEDAYTRARPHSGVTSGGGPSAYNRTPRSPVGDDGGREWSGSQTARSVTDKPPSTQQILERIAAQSLSARELRPLSALPSSSPSILLQQQQLQQGGIDGRRGSESRHTVTGASLVPLGGGSQADVSGSTSRIILPHSQPPPVPSRSAVTSYVTMRHRPQDAAPMLASVVGAPHVKRSAAQAKYSTMVPLSTLHATAGGGGAGSTRSKRSDAALVQGSPSSAALLSGRRLGSGAALSPNTAQSPGRPSLDAPADSAAAVSRAKSMHFMAAAGGGLGSGPGAYAAYRDEGGQPQAALRTRSDAAMLLSAGVAHNRRQATLAPTTVGVLSPGRSGTSRKLETEPVHEVLSARGRSASGVGGGLGAGYVAYDAQPGSAQPGQPSAAPVVNRSGGGARGDGAVTPISSPLAGHAQGR